MRILTTGSSNGIGRYIHEQLGGMGLDKDTPVLDKKKIENKGADVVIHCAFNPLKEVSGCLPYGYVEDNLFFTEKMASLTEGKFILFSSVDVYPKDGARHCEDEAIKIDKVSGVYGVVKLMAECIVKERCSNYLILRCASLLGKYTRNNNLLLAIKQKNPHLTLTLDSALNYVSYDDVLGFIKYAIDKDLKGIYNVASLKNITISKVSDMLRNKVYPGKYRYNVGKIDNKKVASVFSAFKKTSKEVINEYRNS